MIRKITIAGFILSAFAVSSQEVCSFTLFFSSNNHQLKSECRKKIDSVIKTLSNIPKAYNIKICGHTDNESNLAYNKKLSAQRSASVKAFFVKQGFLEKNITCNAYAFTQPATDNISETGKAKNRRVTIQIAAPTLMPGQLFKQSVPVRYCVLNSKTGGKFKYTSGSEITVPAGAFECADGAPVTGDVKISYTEYRNPVDFIKSQIPMSFFNEEGELVQFNSGGMFEISASQGDKKLKLKTQNPIKISFAKTQTLPNMDFFGYDTTTNAWHKNEQQLSNKKSDRVVTSKKFTTFNSFNPMSSWNNKQTERIVVNDAICTLHPCIANAFAARKGVDLAFAPTPIDLDRAKIYFKEMYEVNNKTYAYTLKIASSGKNFVKFKLIPLDESSAYDNFKEYVWIYRFNKTNRFKEQLANTTWLNLKMDYFIDNDFFLTLYNNAEKVKLRVKAEKPKGMHNAQVYAMHYTNKTIFQAKVLEQNKQRANFDLAVNEEIYNAGRKPYEFLECCNDSLFCFYQISKKWMDTINGESKLEYKPWLDYFNTNKSLMKNRYLKLLENTKTVTEACYATELKRREQDLKNRRLKYISDSVNWVHQGEQYASLNKQFEALSIDNLGIWNCDQVQRLQEPVYVKKTYKDAKGKKVEPIVVYIIDKKVSGALTYNGYMNLSPYYFPISSKSENTLIAFDCNNKGYICTADKMAAFIKQKDGTQIILEPIKDADTDLASLK